LMIPCVNQATVLTSETPRFLEAARKSSFTHVELDIQKIEEQIQKNGLPSLKRNLADNRIEIVSLNAIENLPISTQDEMEKSVATCDGIIDMARKLDCNIVVVNPSESSGEESSWLTSKFETFLMKIAEVARRHNVRLGFEYVSYGNRVVNRLDKTVQRLGQWDQGIGLVLDAFHMYRSQERVSAIPESLMGLLWIFHVNDAPNIPIEVVRDTDRVFPFEGVTHPEDFVEELKRRGFNGPVSIELFNKSYWRMDTEYVVAKAKESLDRLGVA
jgi:2-keto-myo-inositol isomerase